MTDVRKALEVARANACRWMQCSDECLKLPDCKKASYAAILAFLRAMPEQSSVPYPGTISTQLVTNWTPSRIVAELERDT